MVTMDFDCAEGLRGSVISTVSSLKEIDELRYSRLIYTVGRDAVQALHRSKVLILGCKGLGAEIAKNLLLSGIKGLGLVDDEVVSLRDLGTNFLLSELDVGRNRAVVCAGKLKEMNPAAEISVIPLLAIESSLGVYNVLVATMGSSSRLVGLNKLCRSKRVSFVLARTRGVFSSVFVDFGDSFSVLDETGEPGGAILVESITQDYPTTITVVEEQRHGLEDGDQVVFSGIKGMQELNRSAPYSVTVTGTNSFTVPDDSRKFGRYLSGGYFHKVKPVKVLNFEPLERALRLPKFCITDFVKPSNTPHIHVAFQAMDEVSRRRNCSLAAHTFVKEEDLVEILDVARELWGQSIFDDSVTGCGSRRNMMEEIVDGIRPTEDELRLRGGDTIVDNNLNQGVMDNTDKYGRNFTAQLGSINEEIVKLVAHGAHVELCPIVAVTGGIAAQEVIKAISRVFTPQHQWLYFDASDCLPTQSLHLEENATLESRYDLQTALFGADFQESLGRLQWLVVGAGGIGSEVLKNLVMMGVGCNPAGSITITDMDKVSRPNLTDQLLYHIDDVDRPKSPAAARALRSMNPSAQIHALQEKFSVDTENIFDSSFFNSISGVFSAVDTAQSRLYIDSRCVAYRTPMIDGGKHGTKGSVQVFVPFQSEMYASTRDPPEHKETPICTLKNFPYAPEHTLRWAVETFEALFKKRPLDVNAYLSTRNFQDSVRKSPPSARLTILETLRDALLRHRPLSFHACIEWARFQFEDLFCNSIKQLCFNFPPGMTTTAGAPFWSGTKRAPSPLAFDPLDTLHLDFVVAAANLQATVYGLKGCQDRALFVDILENVVVPPFEPKEGVKIAVTDGELRNSGNQGSRPGKDDSEAADACESILKELPTPATLAGYRLTPIDFQKDDERNFHAEFVSAAGSLRACNYGIPLSDRLQARLIGGKIIPAIVTSTAVVGGLMCIELYKVVQNKPLTDYKHAYFNLAVPLFAFAQPIKAVEHTVQRHKDTPLKWTLWDRFELDCIDMSLESFLAEFKLQQGLEVTMISYGKSLLYAEFLPKKKLQDRLSLTLLELINVVGKINIPPSESKIIISVSCTDTNDEDVEVPDVVARIR